MQNSKSFQAYEYWENRLRNSFDLHGVGYINLGKSYNKWLYKIREHVFNNSFEGLNLNFENSNVLDIGSGTGFYVDLWKKHGVNFVTGVDLTDCSIENLKKIYPEYLFHKADVSSDLKHFEHTEYDIISAFDVLFHVVDDKKFEKSLENISNVLKTGGYFFYSDNFLRDYEERTTHFVSRKESYINEILKKNNLEIVKKIPMFVLMNSPVNTSGYFYKLIWGAASKIVSSHEKMGGLIGSLLYPIEIKLLQLVKESPSTELLICRKV